jgi:hypothetical protein
MGIEPLESRQLLFTGGNIFVTGHDVLDHGGQRGFDTVFLDFMRGAGGIGEIPKAEYSIAVLGSRANPGFSFSEGGRTKPGYEATDFYNTFDLEANPALWDTVLAHDGLLVLSWGTGDLTTEGSNLINANKGRIQAAMRAGMDVYAEAAAGLSTYYDFLPEGLIGGTSQFDGSSGVTLTEFGQAIGLTSNMVNGDPFHSRLEGLSAEMVPFDTLNGSVLSAGAIGQLFQPVVGRVFHDVNQNALQDTGETGVAGVTVQLLDESFAVVGTSVTDSNGLYDVSRLIGEAGTYYVQVVFPQGNISAQDAGGDDALDSDVDPATGRSAALVISDTPENTPLVVDAGIHGGPGPASVIARAWHDADEDGLRDASETALAAVLVRLIDATGNEVAVGVTGADGLYTFENVVPGNYRLRFDAPAGYFLGAADQGTDDELDSDADPVTGLTTVFTLLGGQQEASRAAGLKRVYEISGFVWDDDDGDGLQDAGENGLAGVFISLFGGSFASTVTDVDGRYRFDGLSGGDYRLELTLPLGAYFSAQNQGSDDAIDSDFDPGSQEALVTLPTAGGEGDATLDAGIAPVKLEITEFMAINRSGLVDANNQFADWVEITNVGNVTADVQGWHLTDKEDWLTKWRIDVSEVLDPGESVIVFASENCCLTGTLAANFRLAASGEYLALVQPDGTTVASEFSPTYPQQMPDVSYGRGAGGELLYFPEPTPGAPNGEGLVSIPFNLVITEFMAENHTTHTDEEGDYADWIEILNAGTTPVSLEGWYLTDTPSIPDLWRFPNAGLNPGERMIVYASGNDRDDPDEPLHTNFKLDAGGEYLALVEPDGVTVVAEFNFQDQEPDVSFGLSPDLAHQRSFTQPTPGEPNQAAFLNVSFSLQRGFYDQPQMVALSTETAGAEIRYTTDGSLPTATTGTLYAGPITIDSTTTLRAAAFTAGQAELSPVFTQTYLFLDDVLLQDGAGFPLSWGFQPDYEMDGDIVGSAAYHADLLAGLRTLPSVSLVAERDALFSVQNGIYANPNMGGPHFTPPMSMEWLDPTGGVSFHATGAVLVDTTVGSVVPPDTPKLPLRLLFDAPYGEGPLRRELFGDAGPERLDSLLLHAGYEDSWIHPQGNLRTQAQFRRDAWLRGMQAAMGQPALSGRFVHLYINGLYWGVYNLMQPPTATAAQQLGAAAGYDIVGATDTPLGDRAAWDTMVAHAGADLSNPGRYEALRQHLDVENLADFIILSVFAGRPAHDSMGWYAVRPRQAGGVFKFWMWDGEDALGGATLDDGLLMPTPGVTAPYELFDHLRASAEFRQLFADRVERHLSERGALWDERAAELLEQLNLDNPIVAESARWGDYRRDLHPSLTGPYELYTRNTHWRVEQSRLVNSFFVGRAAAVVEFFRGLGLYPQLDAPQLGQYGGTIEPGFALSISGTEGSVYYTLDGTDPRLVGGGLSPSAVLYDAPIELSRSTQVRARSRSGSQWSAVAEGTFLSAQTIPLALTELMFHPPAATIEEFIAGFAEDDLFEFLELKNTGSEPLLLDGMRFTSGIQFDFSLGDVHVLQPGEHVLVVNNRAAFEQRYGIGNTIAGEFTGNLGNGGDELVISGPFGEFLIHYAYSDSDLLTDGQGFSILPQTNQHSAYFGGSPGEDDPQLPIDALVVNEVSPNGDWIELYNQTDTEIDIGGWFISDEEDDLTRSVIPAGVSVPPRGYTILNRGEHFSFGLNRGGETVSIASARDGQLAGYRHSAPYERGEPRVNFGRYVRADGGVDFVRMSEWTPGEPNAAPRVGPIVINEIMYHPLEGELEYIELFNSSESDVLLDGWRLTGVGYAFEPGTVIPTGGYLVVAPVAPAEFTARYNVGSAQVVGPYTQPLAGRGESITLFQPDEDSEIRIDRVIYDDEAPWTTLADGYGASLGRVSVSAYGNDATSWTATSVGGTPGTANTSLSSEPQAAPYQQGFEGTSLAGLAGWNFAASDSAAWNLATTQGPHGGAQHLVASQATNDVSRHEAVLLLNLADQVAATDLALDFWAQRLGGTEGNSGSVEISGDGRNWHVVGQVLPPVGTYSHFAFDLDQAIARAGIALDDPPTTMGVAGIVFVRFAHSGSDASHGFALDDIRVSNQDLFGPNVIAQTPSDVVTGPVSEIVVTFDDPILPATFTPEDVLITTPDGQRILPDSVSGSADGRTWTIALAPQALRGEYRLVVGPELTDTNGNPMSQGGSTVDGISIDRNPYNGSFTLGPSTAQTFPLAQNFESGNLAALPGFSFAVTGSGTWQAAPGGATGGLFQLKADQASFGAAMQEAVLVMDLAAQADSDDLMIDFWITRQGHLSNNHGSLYVSGDGQTWRHLHSMSPPLGAATYFAFDLDAAFAQFGIVADQDVYFSFRHEGRFANDEMTIDDLRISDIDVFGPKVTAHTPADTQSPPLATMSLTFDEPIDVASFTAADVVVTGPLGNIVPLAGNPVGSGDGRTFTLTLATGQTLNGEYTLRVKSDVRDLAGIAMNQDGDPTSGETNGHDDFVTIVHVGPPQPQAFPHSEGFETGSINDLVGWQFATTGSGTIEVTPQHGPQVGTYHLRLSQADPGAAQQEAVLVMNLANLAETTGVYLDFFAKHPANVSSVNKSRLLASDDGMDWVWLADIDPSPGENAYLAFDLRAALGRGAIELDGDVYLQFVHSGVATNDALSLDQIRIGSEKPFGPRIVSQTPLAYDGETARFTITFDEPVYPETFTPEDVTLGMFEDHVNPAAIDTLDNRTFTITLAAQLAAGVYDLRIGPDIFNLRGVPMNQDADAVNGERDGDDTYTSTLVVVDRPQPVPYEQGFEDGTTLALGGWTFRSIRQWGSEAPGLWMVTTENGPQAGSYHLTTSQPGDCWSNHFAILALDLSQHAGATDLVLDFYLKRLQGQYSPDDSRNMAKLFVSGGGAFTQVGTPAELLNPDSTVRFRDLDPSVESFEGTAGVGDGRIDLAPPVNQYVRYQFDLDRLLASAGVSVGGTVYIDFHQLSFWQTDNIALDEIKIYRTIGSDEVPPRVIDVSISGNDWTVPFTQYLTTGNMGTFSFSIPNGTDQLSTLSWGTIDQLRMRFSEDVVVSAGDLRLYGVNTLDYSSLISSFTYQPSSHTAVWTFSQPIGTDKILVSLDDAVSDRTGNLLDGEWQGTTDAMPSGNGVEGGDFTYRMNVLPGDLDRNGAVNLFDLSYVQSHLGTTAHTLGYDAFADFDGSGTTTIVDRTAVLSHLFQSLPTGEPTAGGMAGDVNGDRRVTLLDLAIVQQNFGRTGVSRLEGDLTSDGRVDRADLAELARSLGSTSAGGSPEAEPEPTATAASVGPRSRSTPIAARRAAVDAVISGEDFVPRNGTGGVLRASRTRGSRVPVSRSA